MQGRPYDLKSLHSRVFELSGKHPGHCWCWCFLEHHSNILTTAKASGLDPTCRKNFNKWTICDYFDKLAEINEKYGDIPVSQIWNMDEKGIQLGGGRKQGKKKFIFLKKSRKNCYKLRNDNLELVTVLECVSAAGVVAPTSFVLVEGPHPDIRGVENVGWYVTSVCELKNVLTLN